MNESLSQRKLFKRDMFRSKNQASYGLLAHGEEPVNLLRRRLTTFVSLMIIAALTVLPSHQIAGLHTVKFPFEIPAHVAEGSLLTFPMRGTDQVVRVGQETPAKLPKQSLYMIGFGLQEPEHVAIWALSKPEHLGWFKRQWVSRAIEYSEQTLTIDRLPAHATAVHLPPLVSKQMRKIASEEATQEKDQADAQLARTDGVARLDCWQAPLPFAMSNDFGATRAFDNGQTSLHESVDIKANIGTALKTAGAGEVVAADTYKIAGRMITIYHGDGLYSRYSHLHEFQTHLGEKVAAGQIIGFSGNSGRAEGPYLRWEVIWRGKRLNPTDVLKVSQQTCEETKTPLAQKTNHADRSPASKIYRWMSHQNH